MKPIELLNLIEKDLLPEARAGDLSSRLKAQGVDFTFSHSFTDKVIDKLFAGAIVVNGQLEFVRSLNSIFYRVAFAGVAAVIILLFSIFMMEGSLSFNSLVGISDSFDENLISLLTDN